MGNEAGGSFVIGTNSVLFDVPATGQSYSVSIPGVTEMLGGPIRATSDNYHL